METQTRNEASEPGPTLDYAPVTAALKPLVRPRVSLRAQARRRRIQANIIFVCSSAVAIGVVGLCYLLLRE
jgi:hypothetical protein